MNVRIVGFGLSVITAVLSASAQGTFPNVPAAASAGPQRTSEQLRVKDVGINHKTWERVVTLRSPSGYEFEERKIAYIEMETGKHYLDNGQWRETDETIESFASGAIARKGPHRVIFAENLNTAGAIDMEMSDGQRMRLSVAGLGFYDSASGKVALIAAVKDSVGKISAPNQVIYDQAFDGGFRVAVRYTYSKAGLEQDVILLERPPMPEKFGLSSRTSRLQIMTEVFQSPVPIKHAANGLSTNRQQIADQYLDFGAMQMGAGRAFKLGATARDAQARVVKEYMELKDRKVIVEEVLVPDIGLQLDDLPLPPPGTDKEEPKQGASAKPAVQTASARVLLPTRMSERKERAPIMTASVKLPEEGLVADWVAVSSATNYTFTNNTTYFVSGTVHLSGTTTFEGGAVIKFANDSSAKLSLGASRVVCRTDPYRPTVLTCKDDNVPGEIISGSSGNPSRYANVTYLESLGDHNTLRYLRFSYGGRPVTTDTYFADESFWHCQFLNCGTNLTFAYGGNVYLHNVLVANCGALVSTDFAESPLGLYAEHLTADNCSSLQVPNAAAPRIVQLTNTVLTAVTEIGSPVLEHSVYYSNPSSGIGIFQGAAYGGYYLAAGSTNRNSGTTNISLTLLSDLAKLTTYPPIVYSNLTLSDPLTLEPQAMRDVDTPDKGYHYPPLDHIFAAVTANDITFRPGTAVGWFRTSEGSMHAGHGIHLNDRATARFDGTADAPTFWVRSSTVQESGDSHFYGRGGMTGWAWPNFSDSPKVVARFLRCSMLGTQSINHIGDDFGYMTTHATDSEFWGGALGTYNAAQHYTNCLFERLTVNINEDWPDPTFSMRNCTMIGGSLQINRFSGGINIQAVVKECAFDGTAIATTGNPGTVDYGYNAYKAGAQQTSPPGSGNVIMGDTFYWETGPLGRFYLPVNSPLVDAGSREAKDAGFYHFTTQSNQAKEEDNPADITDIDIGYHYPAANVRYLDPKGAGLVAHLPFDEGSGSTANDASGNAHDGTLVNGPSRINGRVGSKALSFDGVDDYVTVPNATALEIGNNGSDFSVTFWLRMQQWNDNNWHTIFFKGNAVTDRTLLVVLQPWAPTLAYCLSTSYSWSEYNESAKALWPNQWYQVAFVKSGPKLNLYLDGAWDGALRPVGTTVGNNGPIYFGRDPWTTGPICDVDDLRIYNRALAEDEVQMLAEKVIVASASDVDSDGLSDITEDKNGNGIYDSSTDLANWNATDTDADGMPDGWELENFGSMSQVGTSAQGANWDYDGDGVSNLFEYLQGRTPTIGAVPDTTGLVNLKVHTPLK